MTLRRPIAMSNGTTMTALEIQWELYEQCRAHAERHGADLIGPSGGLVLDRWEEVLQDLETDPERLADRLDWPAKFRLLDAYAARHELEWDDHRLAALDLQYHDLRPERSLFAKLGVETLISDLEAERCATEPPPDTRAWFRGQCLARWPSQVVAANWDSLVFDIGAETLRRVPMMDPLRGTRALVGEVLEASSSPADLLRRLDAS